MKELIVYIALSGICIGIFFLIYRIFLRSTTFFQFNRAFLVIGLITSFIIPSIRFSYDVVLPFSISTNVTGIASTPKAPGTLEIDIWVILSAIYITGVAIQLIRNLTSYRRIFKLIKSGESYKYDNYKLIDSIEIKSPFSVLNCIAINTKDLTETEKDLIIKHEITHISQKHWIDLLCSECALLLQWFNPLMWFYVSSQKENHEFLADKAVIDSGISPAVYQAALINQRFQGPVFSFSNSFNYPNQLNRLFMIKKAKTSPWRKIAVLALIPSFGLFFWASATPRYIFNGNSYKISEVPAQDSAIQVIGYAAEDRSKNTDPNKALVIIDGKESSSAEMGKIEPNNIESINVIKDQLAIKMYGNRGENGVIIITTKRGTVPPVMISVNTPTSTNDGKEASSHIIMANPNSQSPDPNTISVNQDKNGLSIISNEKEEAFKMTSIPAENRPIVFIDGNEVSSKSLQTINPNTIEKMEVLTGDNATSAYGERGKKQGVILITLKK